MWPTLTRSRARVEKRRPPLSSSTPSSSFVRASHTRGLYGCQLTSLRPSRRIFVFGESGVSSSKSYLNSRYRACDSATVQNSESPFRYSQSRAIQDRARGLEKTEPQAPRRPTYAQTARNARHLSTQRFAGASRCIRLSVPVPEARGEGRICGAP